LKVALKHQKSNKKINQLGKLLTSIYYLL